MDIRDNIKGNVDVSRVEKPEMKPERLKEAERFQELVKKTEDLVDEVKQNGNELLNKIQERKPQPEIIVEFETGEKGIEEEAKRAASLIIKGNNMEDKEGSGKNLSKEEIVTRVAEINKELDSVNLDAEQLIELQKQRDELLNMLPEYQGDWGRGPGVENENNIDKTIRASDAKSEIIEVTKELKQTTIEEIEKLMGDSNSELFIINKAINFEEEKIPELESSLAELEASDNNIQKEERIKSKKANIEEHKKILEKLKNKVKNIVNKLNEEN